MDQPSSSSSIRLGGRAIDRHNPIIHDGRRFTPPPSPNPKSSSPHHQSHKTKLSLETSCSDQTRLTKRKNKKGYVKSSDGSGKSPMGCFSSDITTPQGSSRYLLGNNNNPVFFDGFVDSDPVPIPIEPEITEVELEEDRVVINASKYGSFSGFLEKKQPDFFEGFLDYDPVLSPDHPFTEPTKASPTTSLSSIEDKDVSSSPDFNFSSLPPPPPPPPPPSPPPQSPQPTPPPEKAPSSDEVVVLRVSLHCKGCAGKVKKHLSKMKGVTSFNIDFAAKKVTVAGDVTPLTVLNTISKVKNAQFWPEIIPNQNTLYMDDSLEPIFETTTIKDLLRSKHHGNVYAPQVFPVPAHTTTIKGLLRSGPSPPGDHPPRGPPPHTTIKDMQRSKHQGNAYANAPQVVPAHTTIKGFRRSGLPKGTADAPEVPPTAAKSETVF